MDKVPVWVGSMGQSPGLRGGGGTWCGATVRVTHLGARQQNYKEEKENNIV